MVTHKSAKLVGQANKLVASSNYGEAIIVLQALDRLTPKSSQVLISLGNCYERLANIQAAVQHYKKSLDCADRGVVSPQFIIQTATMSASVGDYTDAVHLILTHDFSIENEHSIARCFDFIKSLLNSGIQVDELDSIIEILNKEWQNDEELLIRLCILLFEHQQIAAANCVAEVAISADNESQSVIVAQAQNYIDGAAYSVGIFLYQRVFQACKLNHVASYNLGCTYQELNRYQEAISCYQRAIEIDPSFVGAYNNLANIHKELGQFNKALELYTRALKLGSRSESSLLYSSMGASYADKGEIRKAIDCYKESLQINPEHWDAYSNLVYAMCYDDSISEREILETSCTWDLAYRESKSHQLAQFHFANLEPPKTNHSLKATPTKIRIGFVSGDLRQHSVAYFFLPLLRALDSDRFRVFCYSNHPMEDNVSEEIKKLIHSWKSIYKNSDIEACELIREDRLDLLIDLSGHTSHHRQGIFQLKPVSIQACWLGYPNTTGNSQIDYRLTDECVDPVGVSDCLHSEKLVRVDSGFLCYEGDASILLKPRNEMQISKKLIFGSFNNIAKISDYCIEQWCEILMSIPNSALTLKSKLFADESVQEDLLLRFESCGFHRDNIALVQYSADYKAHMTLYNGIDIALDTSPYNGTTSTCEALWMGVPVITIPHESHRGRVSKSILSRIPGMNQFICNGTTEAIELVQFYSNQPLLLVELKKSLRKVMSSSNLMNADLHANSMEVAFNKMLEINLAVPGASGVLQASVANRQLHIGGQVKSEDWEILDAIDSDIVDHVCNATQLAKFSEDVFHKIYASHVLEHFDYLTQGSTDLRDGELVRTLQEWLRVLRPGGQLMISVPNLEILSEIFIGRSKFDVLKRIEIMRMIFGGHTNEFDYHKVGFDEVILKMFLELAGYENIQQVESFGEFRDTSEMAVDGVFISLNMTADKPK